MLCYHTERVESRNLGNASMRDSAVQKCNMHCRLCKSTYARKSKDTKKRLLKPRSGMSHKKIAAVSATRLAEHIRNSQQNITTKWTPHFACRWAKMVCSTYCHTTKYHDWVDAPQCMSMGQKGSFNLTTVTFPAQ